MATPPSLAGAHISKPAILSALAALSTNFDTGSAQLHIYHHTQKLSLRELQIILSSHYTNVLHQVFDIFLEVHGDHWATISLRSEEDEQRGVKGFQVYFASSLDSCHHKSQSQNDSKNQKVTKFSSSASSPDYIHWNYSLPALIYTLLHIGVTPLERTEILELSKLFTRGGKTDGNNCWFTLKDIVALYSQSRRRSNYCGRGGGGGDSNNNGALTTTGRGNNSRHHHTDDDNVEAIYSIRSGVRKLKTMLKGAVYGVAPVNFYTHQISSGSGSLAMTISRSELLLLQKQEKKVGQKADAAVAVAASSSSCCWKSTVAPLSDDAESKSLSENGTKEEEEDADALFNDNMLPVCQVYSGRAFAVNMAGVRHPANSLSATNFPLLELPQQKEITTATGEQHHESSQNNNGPDDEEVVDSSCVPKSITHLVLSRIMNCIRHSQQKATTTTTTTETAVSSSASEASSATAAAAANATETPSTSAIYVVPASLDQVLNPPSTGFSDSSESDDSSEDDDDDGSLSPKKLQKQSSVVNSALVHRPSFIAKAATKEQLENPPHTGFSDSEEEEEDEGDKKGNKKPKKKRQSGGSQSNPSSTTTAAAAATTKSTTTTTTFFTRNSSRVASLHATLQRLNITTHSLSAPLSPREDLYQLGPFKLGLSSTPRSTLILFPSDVEVFTQMDIAAFDDTNDDESQNENSNKNGKGSSSKKSSVTTTLNNSFFKLLPTVTHREAMQCLFFHSYQTTEAVSLFTKGPGVSFLDAVASGDTNLKTGVNTSLGCASVQDTLNSLMNYLKTFETSYESARQGLASMCLDMQCAEYNLLCGLIVDACRTMREQMVLSDVNRERNNSGGGGGGGGSVSVWKQGSSSSGSAAAENNAAATVGTLTVQQYYHPHQQQYHHYNSQLVNEDFSRLCNVTGTQPLPSSSTILSSSSSQQSEKTQKNNINQQKPQYRSVSYLIVSAQLEEEEDVEELGKEKIGNQSTTTTVMKVIPPCECCNTFLRSSLHHVYSSWLPQMMATLLSSTTSSSSSTSSSTSNSSSSSSLNILRVPFSRHSRITATIGDKKENSNNTRGARGEEHEMGWNSTAHDSFSSQLSCKQKKKKNENASSATKVVQKLYPPLEPLTYHRPAPGSDVITRSHQTDAVSSVDPVSYLSSPDSPPLDPYLLAPQQGGLVPVINAFPPLASPSSYLKKQHRGGGGRSSPYSSSTTPPQQNRIPVRPKSTSDDITTPKTNRYQLMAAASSQSNSTPHHHGEEEEQGGGGGGGEKPSPSGSALSALACSFDITSTPVSHEDLKSLFLKAGAGGRRQEEFRVGTSPSNSNQTRKDDDTNSHNAIIEKGDTYGTPTRPPPSFVELYLTKEELRRLYMGLEFYGTPPSSLEFDALFSQHATPYQKHLQQQQRSVINGGGGGRSSRSKGDDQGQQQMMVLCFDGFCRIMLSYYRR